MLCTSWHDICDMVLIYTLNILPFHAGKNLNMLYFNDRNFLFKLLTLRYQYLWIWYAAFRAEDDIAHCPEFLCTNRKVLDQQIIHNHKNVRKFHCAECSYSSNYLNNFKFHQKVHQGIPANFPCPYCPKTFYLEARLRCHMLVHTDDRNFGLRWVRGKV